MPSLPPTLHHDFNIRLLWEPYRQIWTQGSLMASGQNHCQNPESQLPPKKSCWANRLISILLQNVISSPSLAFRDKERYKYIIPLFFFCAVALTWNQQPACCSTVYCWYSLRIKLPYPGWQDRNGMIVRHQILYILCIVKKMISS